MQNENDIEGKNESDRKVHKEKVQKSPKGKGIEKSKQKRDRKVHIRLKGTEKEYIVKG